MRAILTKAGPGPELPLLPRQITSITAKKLNKNTRRQLITMSGEDFLAKQAGAEITVRRDEWECTFDAVPDLIAIIDQNFRITRINKAMADRLGVPEGKVKGKLCHELVHNRGEPCDVCPFARLLVDGKTHTAEIHEKNLDGIFLVTASPICDISGTVTGTVHVMHDVTEARRSEDAIHSANKKLSMLSSITRHDILNQVTGLQVFLELSKEIAVDPVALEYIGKEKSITEDITKQIEFARCYQDIGVEIPAWHDLRSIILEQAGQLDLGRITLDIPESDAHVFADRLIGKVFYNLMENSLRHGGHMTRIGFFVQETGDGATITYQDDGIGIALENKSKLFTRGFGKRTGLGLFLSREILSITGISITETGDPGKGVLFRISVPKNAYRRGEANGEG